MGRSLGRSLVAGATVPPAPGGGGFDSNGEWWDAGRMDLDGQDAAAEPSRVVELEALVSRLRHDLRGVITPAALVGDQLRKHSDPAVQRAGSRIGDTVRRVLEKLDATYRQVPARDARSAEPVPGTRPNKAIRQPVKE